MNLYSQYKIETEKDTDLLNKLLSQLIKKPCIRVDRAVGMSILVSFGEIIKVIGNYQMPEWLLDTSGTKFSIHINDVEVFFSERDWDDPSKSLSILNNRYVIKIQAEYPNLDLIIGFSDGASLHIQPDSQDDEIDLPYWDLRTPEETLIEVGPNKIWSHRPAANPRL